MKKELEKSGNTTWLTKVALSFLLLITASTAAGQQREVAFTIDDLPVVSNTTRSDDELLMITNRLVTKIVDLEIPAFGFVIAGNVQRQGAHHLDIWLDAGLELGNHTYSHPDANRVGADAFTNDIMQADELIRPILEQRNLSLEYFRFPMLRRGNNAELKATISEFIEDNNYRSAPVTIDNQDWVFNRAYDRAFAAGDSELMEKIGAAYIDYLNTIFEFFEKKSLEVLAYEPKQILLLHANALNTEYLDEMATMLRDRGYEFISLQEALTDPIYDYEETYLGTRGLSWIHRVADSKGLAIEMEPSESSWIEGLESNL